MTKNTKQIYIKPHTKAWLDFRSGDNFHIGGSDIAKVCANYSPDLADVLYDSPIKFYLSMINEPVEPFGGNVPTKNGQYQEKHIVRLYRYYDKTIADINEARMKMYDMEAANVKPINRVVQRNTYLINKQYPHAACSPDGYLYDADADIVEAKNTNSLEANKYDDGINPSFMCQVQWNMMIGEFNKADLAIYIDGTWLNVITVEANREWQDFMLECYRDFSKRIIMAREIKKVYNIPYYWNFPEEYFNSEQREGVYKLHQLEPDFTGTDREHDFIREMIKPTTEVYEMQGTRDQFQLLKQMYAIKDKISQQTKEFNILESKLLKTLQGRNKVVFGPGYFFTYKMNAAGNTPRYVSQKLMEQLHADR
jgi:uncharacterized protein YdcH (DUF465 family)